jgi:hypothetical protein
MNKPKAYAFRSMNFASEFMIDIVDADNGLLITKFICYKWSDREKIAQKMAKDYDVEWSDSPWTSHWMRNFKFAYQERYQCDYSGRV